MALILVKNQVPKDMRQVLRKRKGMKANTSGSQKKGGWRLVGYTRQL